MEKIYTALGWQGGTIHQIISEIKRLKDIELKFDLLVSKLKICEPVIGYTLADLNNDTKCDFCPVYDICHIIAGNYDRYNNRR